MSQRLKAIYHDGVFVPQTPCDLPEESEVELIVQGPQLIPPKITGSDARARTLKAVVERMQHNPLPSAAPHLTREVLYERR